MSPDELRHPLRPLAKKPLFEQVVDALLEFIESNGLGPGNKLLSERDLSKQLGVSRSSVREAIATLRSRGLVESRHGEGIFLLDPDLTAPTDSFSISIEHPRLDLPYIWETRQALETQCARLAASRATQDDLAALDLGVRVMEAEVAAGLPGVDGDRIFHRAVAVASHNPILTQLIDGMRTALDHTSLKSLGTPGQPGKSLADHRAILDAIRSHEPSDAAGAMLSHLVRTTDILLPAPTPTPLDEITLDHT